MADYEECTHCGARIELINFALGQEWLHWPSPHGNYGTHEKYRDCRIGFVATPIVDDRPDTGLYEHDHPAIRYALAETREQLQALPNGSCVLDSDDFVYQVARDENGHDWGRLDQVVDIYSDEQLAAEHAPLRIIYRAEPTS